MIKALLWKEWREQRGIAFAGAAVALMIPLMTITIASASGAPDFLDVADVVPFIFAMVVWPLFAALAGATVNSESASLASSGFLFSRPVPRAALWLIKVSIAVIAVSFVVALSYYAALRVDVWVGGWGFRFPFSSDPFSWPADNAVRAMAVGGLYVTFCGAVFLSTFMRRAIAAAIGGLALAIVSQYGAIFAAGWLGSLGTGVERFLDVWSVSLSAVFLLASLYVFRSGGLSGSHDAGRSARRAWLGAIGSLPLIFVLAGFTSTRTDFDTARIRFAMAVPGTDTSIVAAYANGFVGTTLWALEPGGEPRRLTGRRASALAVSPDGEWLVYTSELGFLGTWRTEPCELRAVRVDGTEDRLLAPAAGPGARWCFATAAVSPARRIAAFTYGNRRQPQLLLLTDLEGSASRFVEVSGMRDNVDTYWGFIPHRPSRNALLLYDRYDRNRGVWVADVDTGAINGVYSTVDSNSYTTLASSPSRLVIREYEPRSRLDRLLDDSPRYEATKLVQVAGGEQREIEPLCGPIGGGSGPVAALTPDGRQLYYACRLGLPEGEEWDHADLDEIFRGTLRRRDLATGEEEEIAQFDGYVDDLIASPDGTRFMVRLADPRAEVPSGPRELSYSYGYWRRVSFRYVLVGADGTTRPLDITPDWIFEEWFGNDRLVLVGRTPWYYGSRALAYLELHPRAVELRPLYGGGGPVR